MAEDKRTTSSERRRRPAPTIDLSATEVKGAEPPPSQTGPDAGKDEPSQTSDNSAGRRRSAVLALLIGGAAGAGALAGALWLTGTLSFDRPRSDQLAARVAALETQSKTAPNPSDNPLLAELNARMGKLEQALAKLPAATPDTVSNERLAATDSAMKALGVTLAALNRRAEEMASAVSAIRERADTAARTAESLQGRVEAIERSAKATQDQVAQNSGADTAARRALAAIALRDAVMRGAPYAAELAVVRQLGAAAQGLAPLETFAQTGVPAEAALSRDLTALLPSLIASTGAQASSAEGFFERLQANAGRLVRVHPVGEPAGDDASAVLARIEVRAARNDLAGIESELAKLPPKARALTDPWIKKLAARNAALAASRKLAADSAAALGSP